MKIAMIGSGYIAKVGHGPSCQNIADQCADVELAACCDLDMQKAQEFKEQFGFQTAYADPMEMLQKENPDAAIVCVSESQAVRVATLVLAQNIPLLLEKPPGRTENEIRQIMDAQAKCNAWTMVAMNRRFMPLIQSFKSEQTMSLEHVRYDLYRHGRDDQDFAVTAIHGIDTARALAGSDYSTIDFTYQPLMPEKPHVVNVLMQVTFQSGATGQLSFCPMTGIVSERAACHSRDQTWLLQLPVWNDVDFPGRLEHYEHSTLRKTISGDQIVTSDDLHMTNGFYQEVTSFIEGVRQNQPVGPSLAATLQSVQVADCIRKRQKKICF